MITASEMAMRLRQLYSLLFDERIIEDDAVSVIEKVAVKLESQRRNPAWNYSITPSDPLRFRPVDTKKVKSVQPVLQTKLSVAETLQEGMKGRFSELNSTLELYSEGTLHDRWHIDLANEEQSGPLFHLQHGGHSAGNSSRHSENKLSMPRWMHPPIDIILASELVIANFFPNQWLRLRRDPAWVSLVRDAEVYCYKNYFYAIEKYYSDRPKPGTMLQHFWSS